MSAGGGACFGGDAKRRQAHGRLFMRRSDDKGEAACAGFPFSIDAACGRLFQNLVDERFGFGLVAAEPHVERHGEIGRASCRERVFMSGGGVS